MNRTRNLFRRVLLVKHHRRPSRRVLAGAVELARRARAELTFADALEGGDQIDQLSQAERLRELEALLAPHLGGLEASYRLVSARLEELLAEARQGAPSPTAEPRLRVAQGEADTLIAQAANPASVDLLVAGCVGRSGLEGWLVGDTAARLSRKLDCSILAVKPDPAQIEEAVARGHTKAA